MGWLKRWGKWGERFSSIKSLGDGIAAALALFGLPVAAITAWFLAKWEAYWQTFNGAGYAIGFLATLVIMTACMLAATAMLRTLLLVGFIKSNPDGRMQADGRSVLPFQPESSAATMNISTDQAGISQSRGPIQLVFPKENLDFVWKDYESWFSYQFQKAGSFGNTEQLDASIYLKNFSDEFVRDVKVELSCVGPSVEESVGLSIGLRSYGAAIVSDFMPQLHLGPLGLGSLSNPILLPYKALMLKTIRDGCERSIIKPFAPAEVADVENLTPGGEVSFYSKNALECAQIYLLASLIGRPVGASATTAIQCTVTGRAGRELRSVGNQFLIVIHAIAGNGGMVSPPGLLPPASPHWSCWFSVKETTNNQ